MLKISKFKESDYQSLGVYSLSDRPCAPTENGGDGLTPSALKLRIDQFPRAVAVRLNQILSAFEEMPELQELSGTSAAEGILTGLFPETEPGHSLAMLLRDLENGSAAEYIRVTGDKTVAEAFSACETRVCPRAAKESDTLGDREELRAGRVSNLQLALPPSVSETYRSALVFETMPSEGETTVSFPIGILWSGDDVTDGVFLPKCGKHYTCRFWYDGAMQGDVRGVRYLS